MKVKKTPQLMSVVGLLLKKKTVILAAAVMMVIFIFSGRFLLRILAIYLLPNIYMYRRLRGFFIHPQGRKLFSIFFSCLTAAFPVSELLAHAGGQTWLRIPLRVGYLALPFLLYLFLLLLVFDLLHGLNRLLKIAAPEKIRSQNFGLISICLLFFLAAAVVAAGSLNFKCLRVNSYRVQVPVALPALKTLRIVLAADFHLGEMTAAGFMAEFADKVNALGPDILLIPGDILEGDRQDAATAEFERQFRRVRAKYGIYASPGNHETHGGGSKAAFFARAGITMLRDATMTVGGAFVLLGRDDRRGGGRRPLAELLRNRDRRLPLIILDHRPNDIGEASRCGADIQLSGHSHYGQLFPLNFLTQLQYPLSWGYKKIARTHFFVTCGVQTWGPQVRTAGVSEIMLIDVEFVVSGAKSNPHGS